jgi:hypothetical protein
VTALKNNQSCLTMITGNSYLRNECEKTFLLLFEARATKERVLHLRECAEYVFSHRSSYNIS